MNEAASLRFNNFPLLCKQEIFQWMEAPKLCRLSRVCKEWRKVISTNDVWRPWLKRHHLSGKTKELQAKARTRLKIAFQFATKQLELAVPSGCISTAYEALCEKVSLLDKRPEQIEPAPYSIKNVSMPVELAGIFLRYEKRFSDQFVSYAREYNPEAFLMLVEAGYRPMDQYFNEESNPKEFASLFEENLSQQKSATELAEMLVLAVLGNLPAQVLNRILALHPALHEEILDMAAWAELPRESVAKLINNGARSSDFTLKVADVKKTDTETKQLLISALA